MRADRESVNMQALDDLDLFHLPLESPELAANPMPFFAAARERHPWLATSNLGHVVTQYRAIDEIMRLDANLKLPGEHFVEVMGAEGTGWGAFAQDQMLAQSGAKHDRLRGSVSAAFGPGSVKRMRGVMKETISALLDDWVPKGAFDFTDFAGNFPVRVMFGLLGTSDRHLPEIIDALEIHGQSFNMEVEKMAVIEDGYQRLWRFVDDLIDERMARGPRGDLLDDLIAAQAGGALSATELRQILILLFAAGFDTSKNLLTLLMHSLVANPEVYRRVGEDQDYARKAVKEQLRHSSPSNTYRVVTEAFDYRGVRFPEDAQLIFPLAISGRDPEVFADPERFDPERSEKAANLAFGRGMHICLGQFLAQATVEEGIHLIARRIVNPRFAGPVSWRGFPGVWGIRTLPIAFDTVSANAEAVG
jgi:cytochrome P450